MGRAGVPAKIYRRSDAESIGRATRAGLRQRLGIIATVRLTTEISSPDRSRAAPVGVDTEDRKSEMELERFDPDGRKSMICTSGRVCLKTTA